MRKTIFKTIYSVDLQQAVVTAFQDYGKYAFFHNVEVKDVKKRFRAFCFNGKDYVVKKTKKTTAKEEISNAVRAARLLDGLSISGVLLNIVVPVLIETKDSCFLISEYKGTTLHEHVYNNKKLPLTQDSLISVFSFLLKKGIVHPGFLPRNIIMSQGQLFILDWENVHFSKKAEKNVLRHISVAEFINNWGCLYSRKGLIDYISNYQNEEKTGNQTGSFGKEYAILTGCSNRKRGLKQEIENIILVAESGKPSYGKYHIVPCDLGHLISDTFPRCIDVFHDLFLYCTQKEKKNLRTYLELMTAYYDIYMRGINNSTESDKAHLILPILLTLDNLLQNIEIKQIKSKKNLVDANEYINKVIPKGSMSHYYLSKNRAKFRELLTPKIVDMLNKHLPISQKRKSKINPMRIIEVIDELSKNL